jgi:AcrR family transcriptional regulator
MSALEDKNLEILEAAHNLFTRFGYRKTTMEDIGNEIGLNQASLYHYFNNKEDIFLSVVYNRYTQMKEAIRAAINGNMNLEEKLFELYKQKYMFFEQDPLLQEILELNIKKISTKAKEKIREIREEERTAIQSLLQNAIDENEIPQLDIEATAEIIIRLTEGIRIGRINEFLLEQRKRNIDSMLSELELALNYLVKGFKAGV